MLNETKTIPFSRVRQGTSSKTLPITNHSQINKYVYLELICSSSPSFSMRHIPQSFHVLSKAPIHMPICEAFSGANTRQKLLRLHHPNIDKHCHGKHGQAPHKAIRIRYSDMIQRPHTQPRIRNRSEGIPPSPWMHSHLGRSRSLSD